MLGLLLSAAVLLAAPALAESPPAAFPWSSQLDDARDRVEGIKAQLQAAPDDERLQALRLDALQAYRQASDASQQIHPTLLDLQTRQKELGETPEGSEEAPIIAAERARLDSEHSALEAQARLASFVTLDASQALESIAAQRRELFQARLGQRSASVLSGAFWSDLASTTPLDTQRSRGLLAEVSAVATQMSTLHWLAALAWLVGMAGLSTVLGRLLRRYSANQVPPGRLRREVHAWSRILLAVIIPVLLVEGLVLGLSWITQLSSAGREFLAGLVGTVGFCGYIIGLGHGLLMPRKPSWRLLVLQNPTAIALRHLPVWAALFIGLTWLAENLAVLASVRLSIIILIHSIAGLALILILGGVLTQLSRLRSHSPDDGPGTEPTWLARLLYRRRGLLLALAWAALSISLVCLLIGYVALASFVLKQVIWSTVVLATAYLLSVTATDLARLPFWQNTADAEMGEKAPLRPWLVLLAGIAQMSIALFTLLLLFAPYGQGPLDIYEHMERLRGGLSIGDIQLRPTAIIQGLLLFLLGIAAVKAAKHWLAQHFLPATRMERGMQASTSTLAGYVGYVIVVAASLSATGVGLERVTWIASALSVGIGFGLQAIVQNFVSGLIMLTERPVKVGDWVSLSGVEGDIRRINVRATEIQMSDRSTMVVPNSEFITKIVRNVTHANSMGRIQIKLPLPVDSEAATVRAMILEAFTSDAAILATPAPEVYLDDISSSALLFNGVAYVASPRGAYAIRSRILFDILRRLRAAGIPISTPSTMLLSPQPANTPNRTTAE